MSGEWKRSTVRLVRHRQTKGPGTDRPHLHHRATPRLYSGLPIAMDTVGEFPSGVIWPESGQAGVRREGESRTPDAPGRVRQEYPMIGTPRILGAGSSGISSGLMAV